MALFNCPMCKKEISDKASVCPSCGYVISNALEPTKRICSECGSELDASDTVCKNCGCPYEEVADNENTEAQKVEVTGIKLNKISKKKKTSIIIAVLLIVFIAVSCIAVNSYNKAQAKVKYGETLQRVTTLMLSGASEAEEVGNLVHDVWYNTIYEKSDIKTDKYTKSGYKFNDDFNVSLRALFADSSFISKTTSIEENKESVNDLMKKLTNPSEEYKEAYSNLKELYDAYNELTNLATDPTGSLQSYTTAFNNADSNVLNKYNAMKMYIE